MTVTISIPVDEEVATIYRAASEQDLLKLQIMLKLWLTQKSGTERTLEQIIAL